MTLPKRRIVVLRASRDTVVLTACTVALTLALAHSVRQRPPPAAAVAEPETKMWAGQLADVAPPPAAPASSEPMTSASLTVPKAALALPQAPQAAAGASINAARPPKAQPCDAPACAAKGVAAPRQKLASVDAAPAREGVAPKPQNAKEHDRRFAFTDLNPLPHLPDVVRKPFSYAGSKISGLIDWF